MGLKAISQKPGEIDLTVFDRHDLPDVIVLETDEGVSLIFQTTSLSIQVTNALTAASIPFSFNWEKNGASLLRYRINTEGDSKITLKALQSVLDFQEPELSSIRI